MHPSLTSAARIKNAIAIHPVTGEGVDGILKDLPKPQAAWARQVGFTGKAGETLLVPGADGKLESVLVGLGEAEAYDPFVFGKLPGELPQGTYAFAAEPAEADLAVLGWLLGTYGFDRYTHPPARKKPRLAVPKGVDGSEQTRIAEAVFLARDLINTPASDMGPDELEAAAARLAKRYGSKLQVTAGRRLAERFPMIHAVGRASDRAPRLLDFNWGDAKAPKVTLVGKGVCFDTGGLDLKPSAAMALMKKDMGGAANVLALAQMIMDAGLPVRLRVLIPAVENSVSGNAFRPGDVLTSRKGLSVEIGNTDAEGRLVLADALTLADAEKPDLLIDMATLTGAARVALGPELPPFYTRDDTLAAQLSVASALVRDPLWRMPLWQPYAKLLESKIADINHISSGPFAGSITAALFLSRFVEQAAAYLHFDIFAWTPSSKPGRPEGGEAQGIRALYRLLCDRFGTQR